MGSALLSQWTLVVVPYVFYDLTICTTFSIAVYFFTMKYVSASQLKSHIFEYSSSPQILSSYEPSNRLHHTQTSRRASPATFLEVIFRRIMMQNKIAPKCFQWV
jgi:hypothetical protein